MHIIIIQINTRCTACKHIIILQFFVIPQPQDGATALLMAADKGHRTIAELLISKGADINLPMKVT